LPSLRGTLSNWKRTIRIQRSLAFNYVFILLCQFSLRFRSPEHWFSDAVFFSGVITRLAKTVRPGAGGASLHARLLHRFLDILFHNDRRFPVTIRVKGAELFQSYVAANRGFVLCSAHLPLVKFVAAWARAHVDPAVPMTLVSKYPYPDGKIDLWNSDRIPATPADGSVLIYTRSLLRKRGILMMLADKEQGEYISSNIFRFIGKVHSRVLMCFPRLLEDGAIHLEFMEPPAPECRDEAEVRANLDFLGQVVRAVLAGEGAPDRLRTASPLPESQANLAQRSREIERIQLYSKRQLVLRGRRLRRLLAQSDSPVVDRELLERRLKHIENELHLRSQTFSRAEFAQDGTPLPDPGGLDDPDEPEEQPGELGDDESPAVGSGASPSSNSQASA
jgi:hypothetical protein